MTSLLRAERLTKHFIVRHGAVFGRAQGRLRAVDDVVEVVRVLRQDAVKAPGE